MFFETIYRWFVSLFGADMADFLSGYVCPTDIFDGGFDGKNGFVMYGFIAMGIALALVILYYYVIDHPSFNRWWSWGIMLLTVGFANMFIGATMTLTDLNAGNIGDCLRYGSNGGVDPLTCWMFGLANFIVSVIFFIIFSLALKWWSRNANYSPF